MSMLRGHLTSGGQILPGKWNMQMSIFSNWAKCETYNLDFAAARPGWRKDQPSTPLRPSLALPLLSWAQNFLGMAAFGVNGPDEMRGYWVTGSLSKTR